MTEEQRKHYGNRVMAEIIAVKGHCGWGHKVGDKFEISAHDTAGLCGFYYHDAFPYITMLQFGGGFPKEWGNPDVVVLECMDRANAVKMRLTRQRQA